MKNTLFFTLFLSTFLSCVPAKKYKALEADYQKATISSKGQENQTAYLETENKKAANEIYTLQKQNEELRQALAQQKASYEEALKQAAQQIQDLQTIQKQLVETSTMEANYNRQKLQSMQENVTTYPLQSPTPSPSSNNITINNYPNNNNAEGAMRGGTSNNNPTTFDKTSSSNLSKNLNSNPIQNTHNANSAQIFNLQNEMMSALSGFSADKVQTQVANNQLHITISDDFLYENYQDYKLSTQGMALLNSISSIAKQQQGLGVVIESDPNRSETNNLGYSKAKSVAQLFASQNIMYKFHNKSFSPLAFDTSGTQSKITKTTLVLHY